MKPYYENEYGVLYKGDCLEIIPNLNTKVDLVLTDLPYGTTDAKWDSIIPFELLWNLLALVRKEESPVALFGSEPFSSLMRVSNLKEYKYDWIWNKKLAGNGMLAKKQPLKIHEIISIFYKHSYKPIMEGRGKPRKKMHKGLKSCELFQTNTKVTPTCNNLYYPKSILEESIANLRTGRLHPTQKPVALLEYLIRTYSNENDLVLDFTAGSSSTAIACMNTNRKFIMIEKEENYCEISAKRMEEHLNKMKSEFNDI